jgi:hypothetical protein
LNGTKNKIGQPTIEFWPEPDPMLLAGSTAFTGFPPGMVMVGEPETKELGNGKRLVTYRFETVTPNAPVTPTNLGKAMAEVATAPAPAPVEPDNIVKLVRKEGVDTESLVLDAAIAIAELKELEGKTDEERRTIGAELGIGNKLKKGQPAAHQARGYHGSAEGEGQCEVTD